MKTIYLMRHGQDDENYIGGWSDKPLTHQGVMDVEDAASWIKSHLQIKNIVCSDINRVIETANIVSKTLKMPYSCTIDLREQNKGLLNGMRKEEANRKYKDLLDNQTVDTIYPEGESLRNLFERIKRYYEKIKVMPDDTLIITHRGVINMLYYLINLLEPDMDKEKFMVTPASIHELDLKKELIRKVR